MNSQPHPEVVVTHRYAASAERVYDAWLDPDKAGRWLFATATGKMVHVEIDARVGGRFNFTDRRNGEDVEHVGVYLELDRPRRIVFEFAVEKAFAYTRVAIDIVPVGSGCELTLRHSGVLPEYAPQTVSGWTGILEGLGKTLAA
jgi:uncharacterized protein YndB with AHSA1/START domain